MNSSQLYEDSAIAAFIAKYITKPFEYLGNVVGGTVGQGAMIEQAIAGLQEATRLYLEEFPQIP
jgi:hypothetical protein